MKPGYETTEFACAVAWWLLTAFATVALCFAPWERAACIAPAVCMLARMATVVANNYGENRFLLKSGGDPDGRPAEQPRRIGFGQFVASESEDDEE